MNIIFKAELDAQNYPVLGFYLSDDKGRVEKLSVNPIEIFYLLNCKNKFNGFSFQMFALGEIFR